MATWRISAQTSPGYFAKKNQKSYSLTAHMVYATSMNEPLTYHRLFKRLTQPQCRMILELLGLSPDTAQTGFVLNKANARFTKLASPQKKVILELLDPPPSPSRAETLLMRRARKHFPHAFPSPLTTTQRTRLIERTL